MRHLTDDELLLHHNHDGDDVEMADQHLTSCAECQARLIAIEEVLKLVVAPPVPDRGPDYGFQVWNRIRVELPELTTRERWWLAIPPWGWVGVAAVLLVVVFLLGRYSSNRQSPLNVVTNGAVTTPLPAQQVRERVLLLAVGDHLDRTQMLLMELSHASDPEEIDISEGRQRAVELANANRLYRTTAQKVGDATIVTLLDELERVLLQVGHEPSHLTARDLKGIQDGIQSQGILFKVRVVRANVRRESAQRPQAATSQMKGPTT
ncbi:MAG TPA: hypothetical protein VNW47_14325 [Terriglobales bacterium]|jgi:hypothetical protein|nr:hypothetical protein [Terriglobales bacterium]